MGLQGIGDPKLPNLSAAQDQITIVLDVPRAEARNAACWSLCETVVDPSIANSVTGVIDIGGGQYKIALARPITTRAVTTIRYLGGANAVHYTAHPANVNADGKSNASDITKLVDCLNGIPVDPNTFAVECNLYKTDMNHGGVANASDISRIIDLLNGAGAFIQWFNIFKPVNTGCPANGCIASGGASQMASTSAPSSSATPLANPTALPIATSIFVSIEPTPAENLAFARYFVNYVASANPQTKLDHLEFEIIVETLTSWSIAHFTQAEREALADRLTAPNISPVSEAGALAAKQVASKLRA